jgi:hypothetical protein
MASLPGGDPGRCDGLLKLSPLGLFRAVSLTFCYFPYLFSFSHSLGLAVLRSTPTVI